MKNEKVYGCLWLKTKQKILLDGQELSSVVVNPHDIVSYGRHEIGDEANVYVVDPKGNGKQIRGLKNVRKLFAKNLSIGFKEEGEENGLVIGRIFWTTATEEKPYIAHEKTFNVPEAMKWMTLVAVRKMAKEYGCGIVMY